MNKLISSAQLSFAYGDRLLFDNLEIDLSVGEATVLLGSNGSGKSTLAKLLLGHLEPHRGGWIFPTAFEGAGRVTAVYQDVSASLLPWMSAAQNVALPLRCLGVEEPAAEMRALSTLRDFAESVNPRVLAARLSGGQQQLVAWARAFITDPLMVVLDEPFAALDMRRIARLSKFLADRVASGLTVLLVLHDLDQALMLADKIVVLPGSANVRPKIFLVNMPRPRTAESILSQELLGVRREVLDALWS